MASFDENGKYIKTNWKAGDKITATKLNKIEESIEAVNDNDISRYVEADARLDALEAKDVAHDKEFTNVKNLIADNKAAAELGDYEINSRMTFLENELNEGIEEVHNVAETVDGKIAQGKADMEAMVAEVEADLEGLHAKDEELNTQLTTITNKFKKTNNYLSFYEGVGSAKLQAALDDSIGKILIIDESITLETEVVCPHYTHIKGLKGISIFVESGGIVLNSHNVIEDCYIENTNISSNFGENKGVKVLGEGTVYENITIKNNTIKNFFYNIDLRTTTETNKNIKHNNIRIEGNNLIHDYNSLNSSDHICGNIIIQDSKNVIIRNNFVEGGINSSAIGVTGGSGSIIIHGNIVNHNYEASIQVENFIEYGHSQDDVDKANMIISNNICDGAIWVDDCSNINVSNNKSDSIYITTQQWEMNNIVVDNNITGVITAKTIYSTFSENAIIKSLVVTNNNIIGANGYHDQALVNEPGLLRISAHVLSSLITGNKLIESDTISHGIHLTIGKAGYHHVIYNNYDTKSYYTFNGVTTLDGVLNLCGSIIINVPRYSTENLEKLVAPQIGSVVYDATRKKLIVYKDGTDKWVNVDGTPL